MRNIYAWIAVVILLAAKISFADVSGPSASLDANTPAPIQRLADGLHILDNGTPSTFYDANNGVWLAGVITTPYKKYWVSIDFGGAQPMVEGASLQFLTGARFHAGEFAYDKIPYVHDFVNSYPFVRDGLFKYTAAGAFFSRDWTQKVNRFGPYAGIEYRFK